MLFTTSPRPECQKPYLNLVFPRNLDALKKFSTNENINKLNERQLKSLDWLQQVGEVSTGEYSAKFDIGYKTAQRDLAAMKDWGFIKDNGLEVNSPNYKYKLAQEGEEV